MAKDDIPTEGTPIEERGVFERARDLVSPDDGDERSVAGRAADLAAPEERFGDHSEGVIRATQVIDAAAAIPGSVPVLGAVTNPIASAAKTVVRGTESALNGDAKAVAVDIADGVADAGYGVAEGIGGIKTKLAGRAVGAEDKMRTAARDAVEGIVGSSDDIDVADAGDLKPSSLPPEITTRGPEGKGKA